MVDENGDVLGRASSHDDEDNMFGLLEDSKRITICDNNNNMFDVNFLKLMNN